MIGTVARSGDGGFEGGVAYGEDGGKGGCEDLRVGGAGWRGGGRGGEGFFRGSLGAAREVRG